MSDRGKSRADENKAIRQEALREKLAAGGHIDHVIDISNKLADLTQVLEPADVVRLKAAADIKKGIIAKYIPDLRSIEHTGEISTNAESLSEAEILDRLIRLRDERDRNEALRKPAKDNKSETVTH